MNIQKDMLVTNKNVIGSCVYLVLDHTIGDTLTMVRNEDNGRIVYLQTALLQEATLEQYRLYGHVPPIPEKKGGSIA